MHRLVFDAYEESDNTATQKRALEELGNVKIENTEIEKQFFHGLDRIATTVLVDYVEL